jgi:two-component system, OmpR family, response regulator
MIPVKPCSESSIADDVCRILIVEDNADSAAFLLVALQLQGHDVQSARNGTEALTVAAEYQPHVVLIDICLPGLDGLYVTRELRKTQPDILIVATSGKSGPEDFKQSQLAGCNHHLVKPLNVEQVMALLKDWKSRGGCEDESSSKSDPDSRVLGR